MGHRHSQRGGGRERIDNDENVTKRLLFRQFQFHLAFFADNSSRIQQ